MALYSFIQSLNTTFGTSIYEPVAKEIARDNHKKVETQYKFGQEITQPTQTVIEHIMNDLSTADTKSNTKSNKHEETKAIRKVCQQGEVNTKKVVRADLYVESHDEELFLFDIKTAKPNKGNFDHYKKTLLEWVGLTLHKNPKAKVHTLLAIPYNPYAPEPYRRWTSKGMLDPDKELMIGEDFWNYLGGQGAYQDLLSCFEQAGCELRKEIDKRFARFRAV